MIPYLVFGISLLVLFSAFDKLLTVTMGTYIGLGLHAVTIGHVVVALPYTILVVTPLLERLSISLEEAAHDLGASPWGTFWRVTFPLLYPALISAFLIALTLSFDEYAIASFLAGSSPTWPVFLFTSSVCRASCRSSSRCRRSILLASVIMVVAAEIGRRRTERRYALG